MFFIEMLIFAKRRESILKFLTHLIIVCCTVCYTIPKIDDALSRRCVENNNFYLDNKLQHGFALLTKPYITTWIEIILKS